MPGGCPCHTPETIFPRQQKCSHFFLRCRRLLSSCLGAHESTDAQGASGHPESATQAYRRDQHPPEEIGEANRIFSSSSSSSSSSETNLFNRFAANSSGHCIGASVLYLAGLVTTSSPPRPIAPSPTPPACPPLALYISGGEENGVVLDHRQRRGKGEASQGDSRLHVPGPPLPEGRQGVACLPRCQVC